MIVNAIVIPVKIVDQKWVGDLEAKREAKPGSKWKYPFRQTQEEIADGPYGDPHIPSPPTYPTRPMLAIRSTSLDQVGQMVFAPALDSHHEEVWKE